KRMWVEKADAAMTLFARAEDEALRGLVDEILAEAFTLPEMVRQFLGEHRDLGESLLALADVLQGRPALFGRGAWEKSPKLTGVLKRGQLPATQGALVARLQRVLAGRQPLCVGGPPAEAAVVAELRARLGDGKMNIIGGQATERALAARLTAKG
ncbi:MAG TPA: hypothetical protein VEH84_05375, partial [Alphaproteobacteria bacterium]|nr:hypothetical protein [Alphaproteobacteria bacterium]